MTCVICGKPIKEGEVWMDPPPVDAPFHFPLCPDESSKLEVVKLPIKETV
jgi:hypothetical protein